MSDGNAGQTGGVGEGSGGTGNSGAVSSNAVSGSAASSGGGTSGGAPAWFESTVADVEARSWLQNKGFADHAAQVASHRSLEKLVGADPKTIVRIPKTGDVEGQRALYAQLGMPASSDKYDLGEMPGGTDPQYLGAIKTAFHKHGLSNDQAKNVVAAHNEYVAKQIEQQTADYNAQVAAGEQDLQREWRGGYDRMINQAGMTAKMLGISAEMVDGIEAKIGYAETLKFLANLGTKLGEDSFVTDSSGSRRFAGTMTPAEAQSEWDQLKMDKDFLAALMDNSNPGHKTARERQTRLFSLMYPG